MTTREEQGKRWGHTASVAECLRVEKERLGRGRGACRKGRGREGRYTFVRRDPGQEAMRGDGAVGG